MQRTGTWIALAGMGLILVWNAVFFVSSMGAALLLSFFVLVPLLVEEAAYHPGANRADRWLEKVMQVSLPFAGAGAISVTLPPGAEAGMWASIWFFYTVLIAFGGLMRMLGRGGGPLEELVIDVGLIYIAAGGGWLVVSQAGWTSFLPYSDVIVRLTAVHFHYAAFVVPLVTGFFGRYRASKNKRHPLYMERPYQCLAAGVMIGPILVAIGLHSGQPIEFFLVSFFAGILIWQSIWWIWFAIEFRPWIRMFLDIAAFILLGTMGLSVAYSLGMISDSYTIQIGNMLSYHGLLNAFGFSLFSVIAWRAVHAPPRFPYTSFPQSKLRARGYIGSNIVQREQWEEPYTYETGLISDWERFRSPSFKPELLHPLVREFYTDTNRFTFSASLSWKKGFKKASHMSYKVTGKWGQINLPPDKELNMDGEIRAISDQKDGRRQVRAWIRKHTETGEPIFTALYSHHVKEGETYFNIGLPLPLGLMTGILRVNHDESNGLILTSRRRKTYLGDEGIYVMFGEWTIRTPLKESFYIKKEKDNELAATHHLHLGPFPLLKITYRLKRK